MGSYEFDGPPLDTEVFSLLENEVIVYPNSVLSDLIIKIQSKDGVSSSKRFIKK
ncbi:hypothetical protein [Polaribacter sp.]|uniref:hypothetical protein n=1 Tax=Polaribacter sp. TaxID=1920175 RepID=UPI003EF26B73